MKKAGKLLIVVVLLLWFILTFESSRTSPTPNPAYSGSTALQDHLEDFDDDYYNGGLAYSGEKPNPEYGQVVRQGRVSTGGRHNVPHEAYQGNLFARFGRNVGIELERQVRNGLTQIVIFFNSAVRP